jgi:hypothetical protein
MNSVAIPIVNNLTFEKKQVDSRQVATYGRGVRANIYGLWTGTLDTFDFIDSMSTTIGRNLRFAWYAGAAQCGISQEELTPNERQALDDMVNSEIFHLVSFADSIIENSRNNGGKLTPHNQRAVLWVNRYNDAYNQAMLMACGDQKLEWQLGATERHCSTCAMLNGTVLRASVWEQTGYRPQNPPNPMLECEGWRCDCHFNVTTKPITASPPISVVI